MGKMNLWEVMDKAVDMVKKYFKTIALYLLCSSAFYFIIVFISIIIIGITLGVSMVSMPGNLTGLIIIFSLFILALVALFLTVNVGMIKISSQEFLDEKLYAFGAVKAAMKSYFKVLGITFIAFLTFTPAIAAFGFIYYSIIKGFSSSYIISSSRNLSLIILFIIVTILAIIVSCIYTTLYIFTLHVLTIEKEGVLGSIKRGYQMAMRGKLKLFGSISLIGMTMFGIRASLDILVAIITSLIFMAMRALSFQVDYTSFIGYAINMISTPLSIIYSIVIGPISTMMISILYFNERFKNEGYDMILRLKEIQKNDERKQSSEGIEFNSAIKE